VSAKRLHKFLILGILALPAAAQVPVTPIVQPRVTFVNADGGPCAGCNLWTYAAGTTTPLATYTDATGTSQNTNPIILDAAGGANIWLGANSYKLILKDASGATIWSVDQIRSGSLLPCSSANAIQAANSAVNGLNCDPAITINTVTHTINIGTLSTNYVTIGALGTPTSWTFDTTSPATAAASIGAMGDGAGTTTPNRIALSTSTAHAITYSSAIPDGITAITRAPTDNSTNIATTAYVATPGGISPTALIINGGSALTDNQGTGVKVQHSTGTTTPNNCAKFDAAGNVIDSGAPCSTATPRTCNSNGCYRVDGDGTIEAWGTVSVPASGTGTNTATITFPTSFTTATNLAVTISTVGVAGSGDPNDPPGAQLSSVSTTGAGVFMARFIQASEGGGNFDNTITLMWHATGN
jgi:hypothetical protein